MFIRSLRINQSVLVGASWMTCAMDPTHPLNMRSIEHEVLSIIKKSVQLSVKK